MYGINTGFGKLANVRIAPTSSSSSRPISSAAMRPAWATRWAAVVRAVMLLRANVLLRPTSGVRPELVDALVAMLNAGVIPLVPEQGSVGASGDLAPLSHIGLALMGEGEILTGEGRAPAAACCSLRPVSHPIALRPKEGIAFINGTQAQTALLALLVHDARVLWRTATGAAAMSLEALRGTPAPLDPEFTLRVPIAGQSRRPISCALCWPKRDPGIAPGG